MDGMDIYVSQAMDGWDGYLSHGQWMDGMRWISMSIR